MVTLYLQQRISFGACFESFSYNKDNLLLGKGLMLVELRMCGLIKDQDRTSRMAYAAEASCGLMVLTGQLIG
ncbi:hypothetical protein O0I10_013287, partial [Lichtheimia ornata]